MKSMPLTGSPPMPIAVDWPRPSAVSWSDRLVGERARARDDADVARLVDVAGHDADLALARRDDARAVRADQRDVRVARSSTRLRLTMSSAGMPSVMQTIELDARRRGLEDRVGGARRRHEDDRRVGAGLLDRLGDGVEHRDALVNLAPPLPGVTPPTTLVPYSRICLAWNGPASR